MPRAPIRSLPFKHNAKPALGFEVFRLSELYERGERGALPHGLEVPVRPEFHTLYVGLAGRGRHVVDFTPCRLGAGFITIVACGRVQQFTTTRAAEAWMLLFSPEFAGGRAAAALSPSLADPVIEMPPDVRRDVLALAAQLAAEQARPLDRAQPALLAALLEAILLHAERLVARASAGQPPPDAVSRFLTILERDHARTRSVAHYARAAGISPRRLQELCAAHAGRTAKQLISDRVVLEQKRLLAHTELTVKELAERTGFAEPTNLVKFFRHQTGRTPLEFRAQVRVDRAI
jgi:AraC-like DNA-binding protein